MRTFRRVLQTMLLACVATAAVILSVRFAAMPFDVDVQSNGAALSLTLPDASQPSSGAAVDTGEILARPVFSPSRRPYEPPPIEKPAVEEPQVTGAITRPPPPTPPPPPPPPRPEFSLLGVFERDGVRKALVSSSAVPDARWVTAGDSIEGWKISGIAADSVTLVSKTQVIELQLHVDKDTTN